MRKGDFLDALTYLTAGTTFMLACKDGAQAPIDGFMEAIQRMDPITAFRLGAECGEVQGELKFEHPDTHDHYQDVLNHMHELMPLDDLEETIKLHPPEQMMARLVDFYSHADD